METTETDIESELITAIENKNFETTKKLINSGYDINREVNGHTALTIAVNLHNNKIVKMLIDAGANVNTKSTDGLTILMFAIITKNNGATNILINAGIDINAQDIDGLTALMTAIKLKNNRVVSLLINSWADLNIKDKNGYTALMHAIICENNIASTILINAKADLNIKCNKGETVLILAISFKNNNVVKMLIEYEIEINAQTNNNYTALMHAITSENDDGIEILINGGADVNMKCNAGCTVLMMAIVFKNNKIIKRLLDLSANINIQDNEGHTPLMFAINSENNDALQILIDAKVDNDIKDNNGNTALIHAIIFQNNFAVKKLINYGANIEIQNNDGNNALLVSILEKNNKAVKILLKSNVNIHIKNNDNVNAFNCAVTAKNLDAENILMGHLKKSNKTIFLIGEVSSGKSSFLNALSGNFLSNVSLQRETFDPTLYYFDDFVGTTNNIKNVQDLLENQHIENEKKRNNMENIKVNDVNNIFKHNPLPGIHNLLNVSIIDFPGLNDSDDKDNHFYKLVEKNIHLADMIIYVTDANKAMVNTSEILMIYKLKELINIQYENHHHFIKLVIVINKFDEENDIDHCHMHRRISQKINIPNDDIYRVSSHKILIDSMIYYNKNLVVPNFMIKEISKILKNCGVIVNKGIKNSLHNDNIINYSDIEYANIEDDILTEKSKENNSEGHINGDWDSFINYFIGFGKIVHDNQYEMMNIKYKNLMNDYFTLYSDKQDPNIILKKKYNLKEKFYNKPINTVDAFYQSIEVGLYKRLLTYNEISTKYFNKKTCTSLIDDKIKILLERLNGLVTRRFYLLELLFKNYDNNRNMIQFFIDYIYQNIITINADTEKVICYLIIKAKHTFLDGSEIFYEVLSMPDNSDDISIYNGVDNWEVIIQKNTWFPEFIIGASSCRGLKKLVMISMTDKNDLIRLYSEKIIKKEDFLNENDFIKFIYWIYSISGDKILGHKIFDTTKIIADNYIKIRTDFSNI